ncbi:hypothetical protein [Microvirga makkahensis]|uniref:Uncharacterized protein n=1 Tax=Microvirga makkahensis TaxID=1128670 RepID=A0A7X3SNT7_9HYPH|nr:hypothetical protein [Microvirga makkahensis]MXQ11747.1 hypothetical protein [Microvirga makkahensis]
MGKVVHQGISPALNLRDLDLDTRIARPQALNESEAQLAWAIDLMIDPSAARLRSCDGRSADGFGVVGIQQGQRSSMCQDQGMSGQGGGRSMMTESQVRSLLK